MRVATELKIEEMNVSADTILFNPWNTFGKAFNCTVDPVT